MAENKPFKSGEKRRIPEAEKDIYTSFTDTVVSAAKKAWGSEDEYENKVGKGIKSRIDSNKASEFSKAFRGGK